MLKGIGLRWRQLPRRVRVAGYVVPLVVFVVVLSVGFGWRPEGAGEWLALGGLAVLSVTQFLADWRALSAAVPETPKPLVEPAKEGELLVLVAEFQGAGDVNPQYHIARRLESDLMGHPMLRGKARIARFPEQVAGENRASETKRARELAGEYGAALVIWGEQDVLDIEAHYVVGQALARVEMAVEPEGMQALWSQKDEFVVYVRRGLPQEMTYLSLLTIGQMYYFADKYAEAEGLFGAALGCVPEGARYAESEAALRFYRGTAYHYKQQYDAAIAEYSEAVRLNPELAEAHCNLGNTYGRMGRHSEAAEVLTKAIRLKPDFPEAYFNRGIAYGKMDRHEDAIADLTEAIRLRPNYAEAYRNRGVAHEKQQRYDEAIADHTEAIRLRLNYAEAYQNRANVYRKMGRYDEAIADYTAAIQLKPDYAEAYNNRGGAYQNQRRYDDAIVDHTKAIRLKPDLAEAYYDRGVAHGDVGRYGAAIADFSAAIRLRPNWALAYLVRGVAQAAKGEIAEAMESAQRAVELADSPQVRAKAEMLLRRLEPYGKANP